MLYYIIYIIYIILYIYKIIYKMSEYYIENIYAYYSDKMSVYIQIIIH